MYTCRGCKNINIKVNLDEQKQVCDHKPKQDVIDLLNERILRKILTRPVQETNQPPMIASNIIQYEIFYN